MGGVEASQIEEAVEVGGEEVSSRVGLEAEVVEEEDEEDEVERAVACTSAGQMVVKKAVNGGTICRRSRSPSRC